MAKKAAATANTDELVKQALLKIASSDGPVRLSGKGDHPAVFASAAGANKTVIERLKDQSNPLVAEAGSGKSLAAKLTPAGFALVGDALPEDKVGPAAKAFAEALSLDEQVAFLEDFLPKVPTAAADLEPLLAEAVRKQAAEREARVEAERKRAERLASARAALEKCMNHLAQLKAARVNELEEMLLAAGGAAPAPREPHAAAPPPPVSPRKPPEPRTEEERDFRRDVAERLVFSWRDAMNMKKDEARQFLETALENISGLRRIGEEGHQVAFDGSLHQAIPGVFTDHPVRVTRSGWALEDGEDREYVIEKAHIAK